MAVNIGLEDRGVTFGVHDFKAKTRTREEYQQLLALAGDSRRRIHNVEDHEQLGSTFNARSRAISYGLPGTDPKQEYLGRKTSELGQSAVEHAWPQKVLGGFGFGHQTYKDLEIERKRRHGSLERNIIGNCSIKDDRHVYYGHGTVHYGTNSGTRSSAQYKHPLEHVRPVTLPK